MMAYILRTPYRVPYPCPPVEHGQAIQKNLQWLQPPPDEIEYLEETIDSFSQEIPLVMNGKLDGLSFTFFPARLTQANELPPSTFEALRALYETRFGPPRMAAFPS
jgi:hypothetical protein